MSILTHLWQALYLAVGMLWQVAWSLVLGFVLSGLIQAVVSKERMQRTLGREGPREIALATIYGAASSSCSYAAAAMSKTLFKKGAGFIPSLAFLFASTNLVVELGLILWLLIGWQFTAAEWIGGVVLVVIMSIAVKITYPRALVEAARHRVDEAHGHDHGDNTVEGANLWAKLRDPRTLLAVARNAAMDWSMLRQDLLLGFLIAGMLAAFVPGGVWQHLFLAHASAPVREIGDAAIGPLVAIVTFVCSIGNVPMAAVLWGSGVSFGGVLSFLYADLLVLPLLDIYRRYYGWKMAVYIGIVFYATMVLAALAMDAVFHGLHLVPAARALSMSPSALFRFNYTFWLNLAFGALALYLWWLDRSHPMEHGCHHHEHAD
ncbi:MAG TPA: permease [Candidatus Baltobacteraceae bacterium]